MQNYKYKIYCLAWHTLVLRTCDTVVAFLFATLKCTVYGSYFLGVPSGKRFFSFITMMSLAMSKYFTIRFHALNIVGSINIFLSKPVSELV